MKYLIVLFAALSLLLAGCGSGKDQAAVSTPAPVLSEPGVAEVIEEVIDVVPPEEVLAEADGVSTPVDVPAESVSESVEQVVETVTEAEPAAEVKAAAT